MRPLDFLHNFCKVKGVVVSTNCVCVCDCISIFVNSAGLQDWPPLYYRHIQTSIPLKHFSESVTSPQCQISKGSMKWTELVQHIFFFFTWMHPQAEVKLLLENRKNHRQLCEGNPGVVVTLGQLCCCIDNSNDRLAFYQISSQAHSRMSLTVFRETYSP